MTNGPNQEPNLTAMRPAYFTNEALPGGRDISSQIIDVLQDDPLINLESLDAQDRNRLKLHFIAWRHTAEFANRMADSVIAKNPDYLLAEEIGLSAYQRFSVDMRSNLEVQGYPVYYQNALTREYVNVEHYQGDDIDVQSEILHSRLREADCKPIIRGIDVTNEKLDETELAAVMTSDINRNHFMAESSILNTELLPELDVATTIIQEAVAIDAVLNRKREKQMSEDISRIGANALRRIDGPVTIVIAHGLIHTSMRRYFSRMGIVTTIDYIHGKELARPEKVHFNGAMSMLRKATVYGDIATSDAQEHAARLLLQSALARTVIASGGSIDSYLESRPDTTNFLEQVVESCISKSDVNIIINAWRRRDRKPILASKRQKLRSHERLMNTADQLVAQKLL